MKNSKFKDFLKRNGAVIFSICGIVVIAVAVMLITNNSIQESEPNPEQEYHVDLNEMAEGDGTEDSAQIAQGETAEQGQLAESEGNDPSQNAQSGGEDEGMQVADNSKNGEQAQEDAGGTGEMVGNTHTTDDSELMAESQPISDMPPVEVAENEGNEASEFVDEAQAASSAGSSVEQKDAVDLFFEEGMGLMWPVDGNVVLNYSDEHLIFHPSLNSFRTHDAVAIACDEGTAVVAAADGVVASIEDSAQTGITVTTAIGNDYYLVYGQLEDSELKVGDSVTQGEVIGTIAKVSRFYSKEGDNLYFQVRCGEETLNPMSLLGRVETAEDVANEDLETVEAVVPEE